MHVVYEDNHIIVVNKQVGDIVQGDKTGDVPLSEEVKQYIKERYAKPGEVFLGVVHRLDRPVSGLVLFARTSKALARLNRMFADHRGVQKTYWAIVCHRPPAAEGTLEHWLTRDERNNKAHAYTRPVPRAKQALLHYRLLSCGDRYCLLEIQLLTGRHHQIRCQLAKVGCPIRGDLKYGAPRSLPDGGISLHARQLQIEHPVTHSQLSFTAPLPPDPLWQQLAGD